jgi:putative ABC transport system ATP-binding protein
MIEVSGLRFSYRPGTPVVHIESLSVARGERLFLFGPSGSGKTTLLGLLAGVLTPDAGRIEIDGVDIATLSSRPRDRFRGDRIGYLFQLFNLIPYLSVSENITLPCRLNAGRRARLGVESADEAARRLARGLEIEELLGRPVTELSVGQQQRVAAARALIGRPPLVIADEPTSALDSDLREQFVRLLFAQAQEAGATVVFVSHDRGLLPLFDRAVGLPDLNSKKRQARNEKRGRD